MAGAPAGEAPPETAPPLVSTRTPRPESGRRRPIPIQGSEYVTDIDVVVIAIGNGSNPLIQQTTSDIQVNKWGNILVDEETMMTSKKGVFAGGDIVTGGATVILAMGAGRKAANAIDHYLSNKK